MLTEIGKPDRTRLTDEQPENAVTLRQIADLGSRLLVDAYRQELRQERPRGVEHAERAVARVGELSCGLDDVLERRVRSRSVPIADGGALPEAPRSATPSWARAN
jgi:hypothetical protein